MRYALPFHSHVEQQAVPPRRAARVALRLSGLAMLLLCCACGSNEPPPEQAVIFVIDTLRRDALGCYGRAGEPSPHIDAIAAEGTRFDQAQSTSGWTLPSFASLLTGTWPAVHKALGKKSRLTPISADVRTGPEYLSEQGFATGAIANAAFVSPLLGLDRGFDVFDHEYGTNEKMRRADATVDKGLAFVDAHKDESYLLLIHIFDPHLNYGAPAEFAHQHTSGRTEPALPLDIEACLGMLRGPGARQRPPAQEDIDYIRGVYQGEVSFSDAAVGRFVAELRKMGLYEQTTFVITSDHGEEFWEHRGFEHGHSLYDELVRVPLIVRPAADAAGQGKWKAAVDTQVRVLDVLPTLFDLWQLEKPAQYVGESLMPLIRGQRGNDRLAFCESTLYGSDKVSLRDERYKYILDRDGATGGAEELYDWRTDAAERNNIIAKRPAIAARMRTALADFMRELDAAALLTSPGNVQHLSPAKVQAFRDMTDALGYTGREDDERDDPKDDEENH